MIQKTGQLADRGVSLEVNGRPPQEQYLLQLLQIADRSPMRSLLRAMLDPMSLQTFIAE
jgi:hypothetical protein